MKKRRETKVERWRQRKTHWVVRWRDEEETKEFLMVEWILYRVGEERNMEVELGVSFKMI